MTTRKSDHLDSLDGELACLNGKSLVHNATSKNLYSADLIGNEGEGVSRLVREKCDFIASIPMKGDIDSLNASVAAGVLAYEIVRQRG